MSWQCDRCHTDWPMASSETVSQRLIEKSLITYTGPKRSFSHFRDGMIDLTLFSIQFSIFYSQFNLVTITSTSTLAYTPLSPTHSLSLSTSLMVHTHFDISNSKTFRDFPISNSWTFSMNSQTLNARKHTPIFPMKAALQWRNMEITLQWVVVRLDISEEV